MAKIDLLDLNAFKSALLTSLLLILVALKYNIDLYLSCFSSSGTIEKAESKDLFFLSSLKCFSITAAPRGIDARELSIEFV